MADGRDLIQLRYGLKVNLGTPAENEPVYITDEEELYIGKGVGVEPRKATQTVRNMIESLSSDTEEGLLLKVDKVEGKGLSTNDYTSAEKAEVAKVVLKTNQEDFASFKADNVKHTKYIFGREYLVAYQEKLRLKQAVTLSFSGPSTIEGDAITDPKWILSTASRDILTLYGVHNATCLNKGHSGMSVQTWLDSYITEDMAENPDAYFVQWGPNDSGGLPFTQAKVDAFETKLRTGLATIRASKTVQQMSIVLMMPNSMNDSPNGRDATWFDAITPVIKRACRDYFCCFVDTYNYLLDSTNVVWQDDPYADGRHIHPLNIGNVWITSLLTPVIIPEALRWYGFINYPASTVILDGTELPSTFNNGITLNRAQGSVPYDGLLKTVKQVDGAAYQFNTPYNAGKSELAFRTSNNLTDSWNEWEVFPQIFNVPNSVEHREITDNYNRYPADVSMYRATTGFLIDGAVFTFKQADGVTLVLNVGYGETPEIAFRTFDISGNAFTAFHTLANGVTGAANPNTSGATLGELETEVNELKAILRTFKIIASS